jgi:hypothetical protein
MQALWQCVTMAERCNLEGCGEAAIVSLEDRPVCRRHFLALSYRRLDEISAQIHQPQFHVIHAEAAGQFLEDCMRYAADVACAPVAPGNLEKAQVLDVLLWASELHGYLRRGPRVPTRVPVVVRCEVAEKSWEEKTETRMLSRHGVQVVTRHEVNVNDVLICERVDNGWRVEARVVWTRRKPSGENEAGLEFLSDENFWGLGSSGVATARNT